MNLKDLAKEFPRDAVHWRVQGQPYERNGTFSAMALAYIDARDVMDRLDEVCGPDKWQAEYTETATGRVLCRIGIKPGDEWVWKSDGAGSTQVEGEKGGISDALKRAAVAWGIGRYLYRLDSPWVRCKVNQKNGKTYWRAWDEDPWSKVKNVGYTQPEEPKEYTDAEKRDVLKAALLKQQTPEAMERAWGSKKFADAWATLPEPMRLELQAVKEKVTGPDNPMEAAE